VGIWCDSAAMDDRALPFILVRGQDGHLRKATLVGTVVAGGEHVMGVQHNVSEARSQGVSGTPTFIVVAPTGQEQKLVGAQPFSVFKNVIDSMI